jgi:ankyrin repeat protein/GTPase SAR1 family protein
MTESLHVEFWSASCTGNLAKLNEILERANVLSDVSLCAHFINKRNRRENGMTCLHLAVSSAVSLKRLIELGADVNIQDERIGATPLYVAAEGGFSDSVQCLVDFGGANLAAKTKGGVAPIHIAAENGRVDAVRLLMSYGCTADVADDKRRRSVLHYAAFGGQPDVVKLLLAQLTLSESSSQSQSERSNSVLDVLDVDGLSALDVCAQRVEHKLRALATLATAPAKSAAAAASSAGGGSPNAMHASTARRLRLEMEALEGEVQALRECMALLVAAGAGRQRALDAARRGDGDALRGWLEQGVLRGDGYVVAEALELAVRAEKRAAVEALMKGARGASIEKLAMRALDADDAALAKACFSYTPLDVATMLAHVRATEPSVDRALARLRQFDTPLLARDAANCTLLHDAVERNDVSLMNGVLAQCSSGESLADMGDVVRLCVRRNRVDLLDALLSARALPESTRRALACTASPSPCIVAAAKMGHARCVGVLLRHGAAADSLDSDGLSAVWHASRGGNVGIVRALLASGASASSKPMPAALRTPASSSVAAAARNDAEVAAALAAGALYRAEASDALRVSVGGWHPIHMAAYANRADVVAALVEHGADADPDVLTADGFPPLSIAAENASVTAIKQLLAHGADMRVALVHSANAQRALAVDELLAALTDDADELVLERALCYAIECDRVDGVHLLPADLERCLLVAMADGDGSRHVIDGLLRRGADLARALLLAAGGAIDDDDSAVTQLGGEPVCAQLIELGAALNREAAALFASTWGTRAAARLLAQRIDYAAAHAIDRLELAGVLATASVADGLPDALARCAPALRSLNVDDNRLRALGGAGAFDWRSLGAALRSLHAASNRLDALPPQFDGGAMATLRKLDLSNNRFEMFPRALLELTTLRTLLMSSNRLATVPVELAERRHLEHVEMHDNPLLMLTDEALGSVNSRKQLSAAASVGDPLFDQLRALVGARSANIVVRRAKVALLGPSGSGKTSALRWLVNAERSSSSSSKKKKMSRSGGGAGASSDGHVAPTNYVERVNWRRDGTMSFCFYDFEGRERAREATALALNAGAIHVVFADLSSKTPSLVDDAVRHWLHVVAALPLSDGSRRGAMIIVGTHGDRLRKRKAAGAALKALLRRAGAPESVRGIVASPSSGRGMADLEQALADAHPHVALIGRSACALIGTIDRMLKRVATRMGADQLVVDESRFHAWLRDVGVDGDAERRMLVNVLETVGSILSMRGRIALDPTEFLRRVMTEGIAAASLPSSSSWAAAAPVAAAPNASVVCKYEARDGARLTRMALVAEASGRTSARYVWMSADAPAALLRCDIAKPGLAGSVALSSLMGTGQCKDGNAMHAADALSLHERAYVAVDDSIVVAKRHVGKPLESSIFAGHHNGFILCMAFFDDVADAATPALSLSSSPMARRSVLLGRQRSGNKLSDAVAAPVASSSSSASSSTTSGKRLLLSADASGTVVLWRVDAVAGQLDKLASRTFDVEAPNSFASSSSARPSDGRRAHIVQCIADVGGGSAWLGFAEGVLAQLDFGGAKGTLACARQWRTGHSGAVTALRAVANARVWAACDSPVACECGFVLTSWSLSGKPLRTVEASSRILSICALRDDTLIATSSVGGEIVVRHAESGVELADLGAHQAHTADSPITQLIASDLGNCLYSLTSHELVAWTCE